MGRALISKFGIFLIFILLFASCKEAPLTERKQLILIPEQSEIQLGAQAFSKIIKEAKISRDKTIVEKVKKVGLRIAKAAGRHDYKWEFVVIKDSTVNAFCFPGGKIGIYTGILPYIKNDDELAVVISHEVAHAITRHGAERMSRILLAQLGGLALSLILDIESPAVFEALMRAYGVATEVGVILPFSRKQELEADLIGVSLMRKAEYNPYAALDFWKRMKQGRQGKEPPVYLSTHPADDERIAQLEKILRNQHQVACLITNLE